MPNREQETAFSTQNWGIHTNYYVYSMNHLAAMKTICETLAATKFRLNSYPLAITVDSLSAEQIDRRIPCRSNIMNIFEISNAFWYNTL